MALYSIHSCAQAQTENLELRKKLCYINKKREEVQKQLDQLLRQETEQSFRHTQKKTVAVQTDSRPWLASQQRQIRPVSSIEGNRKTVRSQDDVDKTNKVLEMHSQLLKRYDKEVKLNMTYSDTISEVNMRLADVEKQLRDEKERTRILERDLLLAKAKSVHPEVDDVVLRDVVKEKNKLIKENRKLKKELSGLDHNFFDEIEDLKFALLQSAKLNSAYEKSLRKICNQFGAPYPSPEKCLQNK